MKTDFQIDSAPANGPFQSKSGLSTIAGLEWTPVGHVERVYQRTAGDEEPRRVPAIQALAGHGFAGDRHAHASSPRQLLLAGTEAYRRFRMAESVLRENLLVSFDTSVLRSGTLLLIGGRTTLWLTFHCEPCKRLERLQPSVAKSIDRGRGMLARVITGGIIREGDDIRLVLSAIPPISDDWRARVLQVVQSIPTGQFLTYRALAQIAGVATAYCRAFPRMLAQLPAALAGRVHTSAELLDGPVWDGTELFDSSPYLPPSRDPEA